MDAGFCILYVDDFKILQIFNYRNIPRFSPGNVTGANPTSSNVHMTFSVDKIDMSYVTLNDHVLLG